MPRISSFVFLASLSLLSNFLCYFLLNLFFFLPSFPPSLLLSLLLTLPSFFLPFLTLTPPLPPSSPLTNTALNEKIPSNDVALAAESLKLAKVPVDPVLSVFTPSAGVTGTTIDNLFPKDGKSFASDVTSESILLSIRKDGKEGKVAVKEEPTATIKTSEKAVLKEKVEKKEKAVAAAAAVVVVEKEAKANGVKKESNGNAVDTNAKKRETTPKVVTPLPVPTAKPTGPPAKITPRTAKAAVAAPVKAVAPPANVLVRPANLTVNTAPPTAAVSTAPAWGGWGAVAKNVPSPKKDVVVDKLLAHKGHAESSDYAGDLKGVVLYCVWYTCPHPHPYSYSCPTLS